MTIEEVVEDLYRVGGPANNKLFEPIRNRCLNNSDPYYEVMLSAKTQLPTYLINDVGTKVTITNLLTNESYDYEYAEDKNLA